jgi:hypothetical protein
VDEAVRAQGLGLCLAGRFVEWVLSVYIGAVGLLKPRLGSGIPHTPGVKYNPTPTYNTLSTSQSRLWIALKMQPIPHRASYIPDSAT